MANLFEESLIQTMNTLVRCFETETLEENAENIEKLKKLRDAQNSCFWYACESSLHKFNTILIELLEIPPQKNVYITEYIANGLYENFIQRYIEKNEGGCCCGDKTSFIKQMTIKALKQKENLSLYAYYKDIPQIPDNKERQAYWSPKTINDTDEAMSLFWDWYLLRNEVVGTIFDKEESE